MQPFPFFFVFIIQAFPVYVMKKSILLFAVFVLFMGSACKKEQIVPNRTIITTLNSGNWIKLDGGLILLLSICLKSIIISMIMEVF